MTETEEKALKGLKSNYDMYEKTKKELIKRANDNDLNSGIKHISKGELIERMDMLESMQKDIIYKYEMLGGKKEDLNDSENIKPIEIEDKVDKIIEDSNNLRINDFIENSEAMNIDTTNDTESFDSVELPSKGLCYKNSSASVPVSYLTANDENVIISPNMYKDNLLIDYLLKKKLKTNSISPDDMLEGDRDAIILWLRITGYGEKYPITVTDSKTGKEFETVIDLSTIKSKPFNIKPDSNGLFDFTLPLSKDKIKFKFLSHKENKALQRLEEIENKGIKKSKINSIIDEISLMQRNDNWNDLSKLDDVKNILNEWNDSIESDTESLYTHSITNRIELSIVSVNGNTDREFISKYSKDMRPIDAYNLRKYITDNEPGLDFKVDVERPKSLGGGSITVFLQLDELIFLNIL